VLFLIYFITKSTPEGGALARGWRTGNSKSRLLLSFVEPHKVVPCTIAGWLVQVMSNAGVDTSDFKAHSTRGASTCIKSQGQRPVMPRNYSNGKMGKKVSTFKVARYSFQKFSCLTLWHVQTTHF
jgi:hypothetical protein